MEIKKTVLTVLNRFGYTVKRCQKSGVPIDFCQEDNILVEKVRHYTMTDEERIVALRRAVEYVVSRSIPGAFVECGVWKGGSSMVAALTFQKTQDLRDLYLLDTYDLAIPAPLKEDRDTEGNTVLGAAKSSQPYWDAASVDEVKANLKKTKYPDEKLHFIRALVSDSIPDQTPDEICILRLDTDTYESTKHELEYLYPALSPGGVLLLDDYGTHAGARKAVHEYFDEREDGPLITRLDTSGAIAVKK